MSKGAITQFQAREFAMKGTKLANDTNTHTGTFCGIKVISEAVVNAMTADEDYDSLAGLTLATSDYIPTDFSSIQLSSGTVLLIKK